MLRASKLTGLSPLTYRTANSHWLSISYMVIYSLNLSTQWVHKSVKTFSFRNLQCSMLKFTTVFFYYVFPPPISNVQFHLFKNIFIIVKSTPDVKRNNHTNKTKQETSAFNST